MSTYEFLYLQTDMEHIAMAEVERLEKAKRMGRAWQCLRCYHREQKRTVDRKGRIEDHIMKVHLALEEVPYYCRLCLFRCQRQEQLRSHVTAHKRHVEMAAKRNITDHESCLVFNAKPHIIGPMDYVALSAEDSLAHFLSNQVTGGASATPRAVDQEVPLVQLTEEQLAQVLQPVDAAQLVTLVQPEEVQSVTAAQSEDTAQIPLVSPVGVQTAPLVNQAEADQVVTVAIPAASQMPVTQPVNEAQMMPVGNQQEAGQGVTATLPAGTQVPVTQPVGAVQMAVQGQHMYAANQIQMQSMTPQPSIQSWGSVPVPTGALQPTTMLAQDVQRFPGLSEVLNTIIGTQKMLLATCEQRTMASQNMYHQGLSNLNAAVAAVGPSSIASHLIQMPAQAPPSTVTEISSKADVAPVKDQSGSTPVSIPGSDPKDRTPLDLSASGPNKFTLKEISERPLDLTVKPCSVSAKKNSKEEVPAPKEKDQQKEKEPEEVVQENSSEKSDSETEEESSEDVMGQLLPNEDMTINSPVKRKRTISEMPDRERKQPKKEETEKTVKETKYDLPVDVQDLSARTLVTVVDTFRVAMENNVRAVKETNDLLRENMMLTAKMIDTMTRLQRSMEEQVKGEGKHDEWTRDDGGKREMERSRESWREGQRRQDDRRAEDRRPEERRREDLRRVIERHDRDGRRRGDGERQREKENEVLKSVENKNRR